MAIFSRSMQHLLVLGTLLALASPALAAAASNTNHAKAKTVLPPACLRDATALCRDVSTNALACLMELATAADARMSKACASALPSWRASKESKTTTTKPRSTRLASLGRLLNEQAGGPGSTANCGATGVITTHSVTRQSTPKFVGTSVFSGFSCGIVCCKWPAPTQFNTNSNACCQTLGMSTLEELLRS